MQDLAKLIPFLSCPSCRLSLREEGDHLQCSGCETSYPVRDGIPHFVPEGFESEEMRLYDRRALSAPDTPTSCGYYAVRNFQIIRGAVLGFAKETKAEIVADLGCGLGLVGKEFVDGRTVIGVDFSSNCVRESSRRGLLAAQASISDLPLRDATADLALCVEVMPHFDDLLRPLQEIRRVLKPGGHLILSGLNGESIVRKVRRRVVRRPKHLPPVPRMHPISTYLGSLEKAGFRVARTTATFFPCVFTLQTERPGALVRVLATSFVFIAVRD